MSSPLGKHPLAVRPIAFLSDIHGHLAPLEAVLKALDRFDVERVVVAGDLVLGGDEPLEVWRLLQRAGALCCRGVSDTALVSVDTSDLEPSDDEEAARLERFLKTREALGELVLEQIRRLPLSRRLPMVDGSELLVTHGSPADPMSEITHTTTDEELLGLLDDDPADVVIVGAAHVPFLRAVDDTRVVGLGSVGEAPEGGVAHFAIIRPRMDGAEILLEHVTL